jgi:hypothetical protein
MSQPVIALLGRKDEPTDAVEEYCRYLANALQSHGFEVQICRVSWESKGWSQALRDLRSQPTQWRGKWVLLQYTALAWSARGFPQKVLRILRILKSAGARVGIIFHDVEPYPGDRFIDSLRRFVQVRTMRRALTFADLAIFTVPPEKLSWPNTPLPARATFIPVGVLLPIPSDGLVGNGLPSEKTIAVFGITGGEAGAQETQTIISAVRYAAGKLGPLHLSVFGRHAEVREAALTQGLRGAPVTITANGILDSAEVVRKLSASDVLLFVRANVSSRRTSAIAGIACGLPVIAFSGSETASPITDAGVVLVPPDRPEQLNDALVHVLADSDFHAQLSARSRNAYRAHFSWEAIGTSFAALLRSP